MKRYKRIGILLLALVVVCAVTFAVSRYEEYKEQISVSGQVVLEIPVQSVQTLSWEYNDQSFSFQKGEDGWSYDADSAFPVDEGEIEALLAPFEALSAAFIIEDVEDYGQYGLSDPICTITLSDGEQTWEITLGDFSAMDSQRYLSLGDGNVYLVEDDPVDLYSTQLSGLILHDALPELRQVSAITFSGEQDYSITYEEEGQNTYRAQDVYFAQLSGGTLPLDTDLVEDYLSAISGLDLEDYVTYNATEDEVAQCGLDEPELTISVDYTWEDEDGESLSDTLVLHISRDPEQAAGAEDGEEENADAITAYARVGDSQIPYQISGEEYLTLMAASSDDLRHREVIPADLENVTALEITLEGETYTLTVQGEDDERVFLLGEEEIDSGDLVSALEGLSADSFTDEAPTQKEEISLTLTLDLEGTPTVDVTLYRYDGSTCLAVVDGETVSLVARSAVVDLIEAVNAIVLD